jgi:hypothetical protein
VVFPIVDSYSQFEKEKYVRIRKKKRKGALPMVAMWKRSEVQNYPKFSWMTDEHLELSRLTQAFCSHLTHMEDAFTIQEIWQMIAILKAQAQGEAEGEEGAVSSYVKEYGLQWIDTSTEKLVLPSHSFSFSSSTISALGSGSSAAEFPFLPPSDLVEQASIDAEDVRLVQNKAAHKKRKFDHHLLTSEQDSRGGLGEGRGGALPSISCDPCLSLQSAPREVQEILQFTLPPPPLTAVTTTSAASSSSASAPVPHPLLDANKEFLQACSSLSVLAGKCALKLLAFPDDVIASNLLIREFNSQGSSSGGSRGTGSGSGKSSDAMMNYETHHPFEKLHFRQFLK